MRVTCLICNRFMTPEGKDPEGKYGRTITVVKDNEIGTSISGNYRCGGCGINVKVTF